MESLSTTTARQPAPALDEYRGAQLEVIIRGAGFLWAVGAATALVLSIFFPPTAQIGWAGWLVVLPLMVGGLVTGVLCLMLKHRPSVATIHATSFTGAAQVALLAWLAGGGRAPYTQLLVLHDDRVGGRPARAALRVGADGCHRSGALAAPLQHDRRTADRHRAVAAVGHDADDLRGDEQHARAPRTPEGRGRCRRTRSRTWTRSRACPTAVRSTRRSPSRWSARRFDNTPVSLLLCDVNQFKEINDNFGHTAGDDGAARDRQAPRGAVRTPDVAFRWAGDEFAVILRESDSVGGAARWRHACARRSCAYCRRPDGRPVTIGTGVAELTPGMSCEEVLVAADDALCSHKTQRTRLRGVA